MRNSGRQCAVLFRREIRHCFFSPVFPAAALFFALGSSIPFFALGATVSVSIPGFRQFISLVPYISSIVVAALSMGSWADEKKAGTDRLISSYPVGAETIVLAKFLALFFAYAILLALTLPVPLLSPVAGASSRFIVPDIGNPVAAYAVLLAWGAAASAIGLFVSVAFKNHAAAFLASSASLLFGTQKTFPVHIESAARGILDCRDLVFYLAICAFALLLTGIVLFPGTRKVRRGRRIAFAALALAAIPLSSNIPLRFDPSGAQPLSALTRRVLSSVDSEIKVTWYRSPWIEKAYPSVRSIADALADYRAYGNGHFNSEVIDPSEEAVSSTAQSLGVIVRQLEGKDACSGLLVEYRGEHRVIPFITDTRTLEYDLTRFIMEMADTPMPGAGAKSLQLVFGGPGGNALYPYVEPWLSYAGFDFTAKNLPVENLDPEVSLIVFGSSALDAKSAETVSRFLSSGGRALFFVSGTDVNVAGDWKASAKKNDFLLDALETRGIAVGRNLVLDRSAWILEMPSLDNAKYVQIEYPFWIASDPKARDARNALYNGTGTLHFFWPSPVRPTGGPAGLRFESVIESSAQSTEMNEPFDTNPFGTQRDALNKGYGGRERLAVFASTPARLGVIADEYFPSSMIDYTGGESNLSFMVNCAEWITGNEALLELKRNLPDEAAISEQQKEDIARYFGAGRAATLIVIPAIILLFGIGVTIAKRKKS
jgi:ABC-type uncharacterized transport system involved in gliding motility auxiliary subunit